MNLLKNNDLVKLKWLFALLYFVQGGAISFITIFQKPYLNKVGIPREEIATFSGLLLLPFILKIFFGYLSDQCPWGNLGHRKPYMVLGLSLGAVLFATAGVFPASENFRLYSILVLGASFTMALFDAATDGLAVDVIPEQQQGEVQSFMVGGKAVGVIVLSLSIGQLVAIKGYPTVLIFLGFLLLIPLAFTLAMKTTNENFFHQFPSDEEDFSKTVQRSLKETPFFLLAGFALTYSLVLFGADGLITLHLSDTFTLNDSQIGNYGCLRGLGAMAGSVAMGLLLKKSNLKKMGLLALANIATGLILLALILNQNSYLPLGFTWGAIWGMQEVAFLTLVMKNLTGTGSAFGFASLMAIGNAGTAIGEALCTYLTKLIPYSQVFLSLTLLLIIPFVFLFIIHKGPTFSHQTNCDNEL